MLKKKFDSTDCVDLNGEYILIAWLEMKKWLYFISGFGCGLLFSGIAYFLSK